jgi:hypothetical protein
MWRLGLATENNNGNNGNDDDGNEVHINDFITDDGHIALSCCLLDESLKKSQKKFKKMVKAHESYWSDLKSEMSILMCAFDMKESEELYNKICGLCEQLSKSIKHALPKENKKTVLDFARKKKLQKQAAGLLIVEESQVRISQVSTESYFSWRSILINTTIMAVAKCFLF